jgi:hypothetical protein
MIVGSNPSPSWMYMALVRQQINICCLFDALKLTEQRPVSKE